jgi:hypothetical protein
LSTTNLKISKARAQEDKTTIAQKKLKLEIGGTFWTKSELILTKILKINLDSAGTQTRMVGRLRSF